MVRTQAAATRQWGFTDAGFGAASWQQLEDPIRTDSKKGMWGHPWGRYGSSWQQLEDRQLEWGALRQVKTDSPGTVL